MKLGKLAEATGEELFFGHNNFMMCYRTMLLKYFTQQNCYGQMCILETQI